MSRRDPAAVEALAARVRPMLSGVAEKRMFGGVTFLMNGHMLCCVFDDGVMLRVGKDAEAEALSAPFARRPSETRKMPGFVFVEQQGLAGAALSDWLDKARAHVADLPPK